MTTLSEKINVSVVELDRGWRHCGMAEPRMMDALNDGAIIFIPGIPIAFKLNGKPSGICYEDSELPDGTKLHKGNWYVPTGLSESILTQAFESGQDVFSPQNLFSLLK